MPVAAIVLVPALILAIALVYWGGVGRPERAMMLACHAAAALLLAPALVNAVVARTAAFGYPLRQLVVLSAAQLAVAYMGLVAYWLARLAADCAAPRLRH